ncbi:unnamed protein product [Caenorhabditis auriculariae]|uniref:Uncharacterized protein n=1 Tax=Caenorhabditis auriculariae TaxID=2777116 RepID=A0A8S1H1H2_9PELO|nr:unnamed protein product [Caenorhabditis auriculariae]
MDFESSFAESSEEPMDYEETDSGREITNRESSRPAVHNSRTDATTGRYHNRNNGPNYDSQQGRARVDPASRENWNPQEESRERHSQNTTERRFPGGISAQRNLGRREDPHRRPQMGVTVTDRRIHARYGSDRSETRIPHRYTGPYVPRSYGERTSSHRVSNSTGREEREERRNEERRRPQDGRNGTERRLQDRNHDGRDSSRNPNSGRYTHENHNRTTSYGAQNEPPRYNQSMSRRNDNVFNANVPKDANSVNITIMINPK